jgi:hypothetical protein
MYETTFEELFDGVLDEVAYLEDCVKENISPSSMEVQESLTQLMSIIGRIAINAQYTKYDVPSGKEVEHQWSDPACDLAHCLNRTDGCWIKTHIPDVVDLSEVELDD